MISLEATKGKFEGWFKYQYLNLIILVFAILAFYNKDWEMVRLDITMLIVVLLATMVWSAVMKRSRDMHLKNIEDGMALIQRDVFQNSPWPYVVLDLSGDVKWHNPKFEELIGSKDAIMNENINRLITELHVDQFKKDVETFDKEIVFDGRTYRVYVHLIEVPEQKNEVGDYVYSVAFFDKTDYEELMEKYTNEKITTMLISVDNYEGIIMEMEEIKTSILFALIDKSLNEFAESIDAILKKYEKDKYILLFTNDKIKMLEQNKFEIIDKIRKIDVGNEVPITLSVGVGGIVTSLTQNFDYAKEAIDLAVGRGGDQVIIKYEDKYTFFGGKEKPEVDKKTKVKSRVKALELKSMIEEADNVLVMGHKRPDLDCLGAGVGVYRIAKHLGKEAHIILNDVNTSIHHLYSKLKLSGEFQEDMFVDGNFALDVVNKKTLLVIVDVNAPTYTEFPDIIEKVDDIVVFDHHRKTTDYVKKAKMSYVETYASSASEMITEMIQYIDGIELNALEAESLLAGITVDTQNFIFRVGVRTFEAAAFLRRNGAKGSNVSMLFQNNIDSFMAKNETLSNTEIFNDNVAIAIGTSKAENPSLVAAQSANDLLTISGVKASFVLTEIKDDVVISARSFGDINVQRIMEKLGGGGHFTAAGGQLKNEIVENAVVQVKNVITEYFREV
ncbi:MAG: DHH family phosphoesterase [Clostridia bacterium]|jgi:c-di-AMP phosphodiesterase-like protein|nr:DHH family phosphoesterase [Clostridia bacterium]